MFDRRSGGLVPSRVEDGRRQVVHTSGILAQKTGGSRTTCCSKSSLEANAEVICQAGPEGFALYVVNPGLHLKNEGGARETSWREAENVQTSSISLSIFLFPSSPPLFFDLLRFQYARRGVLKLRSRSNFDGGDGRRRDVVGTAGFRHVLLVFNFLETRERRREGSGMGRETGELGCWGENLGRVLKVF